MAEKSFPLGLPGAAVIGAGDDRALAPAVMAIAAKSFPLGRPAGTDGAGAATGTGAGAGCGASAAGACPPGRKVGQ